MNLTIRKITEQDLDPLYLLLSDPRVMIHLEEPYSKDAAEQFLHRCGMCESPLIYAVEDDDGFAGYVIFHAYDEDSMELGWVLSPLCWNKGYASELTRQMIAKCREMGKQAVIECDKAQEITKHIALKYGFTFEGNKDRLEIYRLKC